MPIRIDTKATGPFFDHGTRDIKEAATEWQKDMIAEGEAKLQSQLTPGHGFLTGRYSRHIRGTIQQSRFGNTYGKLKAGEKGDYEMVIIGAWLEGGRSRHERTRFKGYAIWRKTRQHLNRLARELAGKVYARATKRLT